jgi:hypothetical protein
MAMGNNRKDKMMFRGVNISGALFDNQDRKHRYKLWRIWNADLPCLQFVGLNPSKASEYNDDPTITRLIGFAKSWGYGGLWAGNLYSIVSPYPRVLLTPEAVESPGGPNDLSIKEMRSLCSKVMVGWGEFGKRFGTRPAEVLKLLGDPVYCLKVNPSGEPTHPLYLPRDSQLKVYSRP